MIEVGTTEIVILWLAVPLAPTQVTVYVVVAVSGGVVKVPDVLLIPAGEEEQEVLSGDDHFISAVLLYATSGGVAVRVMMTGPFEDAAVFMPPTGEPHAASIKFKRIIVGKNLLVFKFGDLMCTLYKIQKLKP
jgi:hypothetical protein